MLLPINAGTHSSVIGPWQTNKNSFWYFGACSFIEVEYNSSLLYRIGLKYVEGFNDFESKNVLFDLIWMFIMTYHLFKYTKH